MNVNLCAYICLIFHLLLKSNITFFWKIKFLFHFLVSNPILFTYCRIWACFNRFFQQIETRMNNKKTGSYKTTNFPFLLPTLYPLAHSFSFFLFPLGPFILALSAKFLCFSVSLSRLSPFRLLNLLDLYCLQPLFSYSSLYIALFISISSTQLDLGSNYAILQTSL